MAKTFKISSIKNTKYIIFIAIYIYGRKIDSLVI